MTPRKTSAAAMRRAREELLAGRSAPRPPIADEFRVWLEVEYRPSGRNGANWAGVRPFVIDSLERSAVRGTASLRKHVTYLVRFGQWLIGNGKPLDASSFVRANIAEYTRTGMPDVANGTRIDVRSRLNSLADQIHPELAPIKPVIGHRDALKPPYTAEEMKAIVRAAKVQSVPTMIRQMCLCVGLGAGAGIDSNELKLLRGQDIIDHAADGIEIAVPGSKARTVWVLREYEALVRRGIEGIRANQPLLGMNRQRHNVANSVFDRARINGSTPKPEQSRLRTTWIATLMSRPIPMAVICRAAGLRSTRTLFDLLPVLPDYSPAESVEALRDGGQA